LGKKVLKYKYIGTEICWYLSRSIQVLGKYLSTYLSTIVLKYSSTPMVDASDSTGRGKYKSYVIIGTNARDKRQAKLWVDIVVCPDPFGGLKPSPSPRGL